jgi:hypothetical protein
MINNEIDIDCPICVMNLWSLEMDYLTNQQRALCHANLVRHLKSGKHITEEQHIKKIERMHRRTMRL